MRKNLLLLIAILISGATIAQNQLFISEYVEGSGNNRALELYNPSSADVRLQDSGFVLVRYSNGTEGVYTLPITGVVPSHGTYVLVSDKLDPNGSGYDTMVDPALQAKADTFVCPNYVGNFKMFYFNGNDAITLEKPNGVYVDIFGEIGVNPGESWTMDPNAGYGSSTGARWWTKNHTLIRKASITEGDTINPSPFIVATEWDSLPKNTFTFLGSHPNPVGVQNAKKINNAFFYPNPSTNGWFMVKGTEVINSVEVLNVIGQSMAYLQNPAKRGDMRINTTDFTKGIYLVRINFADNTSIIKKIIIE